MPIIYLTRLGRDRFFPGVEPGEESSYFLVKLINGIWLCFLWIKSGGS